MTVLEEVKLEGYQEGMEKGVDMGTRNIIQALIAHFPDATDEAIAGMTSKPVALIIQIRREMKKTNGRKKKNS